MYKRQTVRRLMDIREIDKLGAALARWIGLLPDSGGEQSRAEQLEAAAKN